jgi:hypothetical protein
MTKIFKAFLWTAMEVVHDGKCLVAGAKVQRPLHLGRLGVMDFNHLGHAIHLR